MDAGEEALRVQGAVDGVCDAVQWQDPRASNETTIRAAKSHARNVRLRSADYRCDEKLRKEHIQRSTFAIASIFCWLAVLLLLSFLLLLTFLLLLASLQFGGGHAYAVILAVACFWRHCCCFFVTAVACIEAVAGIHANAGVPLIPDDFLLLSIWCYCSFAVAFEVWTCCCWRPCPLMLESLLLRPCYDPILPPTWVGGSWVTTDGDARTC